MRLIDADVLKARIMLDAPSLDMQWSAITKAFILAMIDSKSITPTVAAVPVVKCKNCKHAVMTADGNSVKNEHAMKVKYIVNDITGLPVAYCPACGKHVIKYVFGNGSDSVNYCPFCGVRLDWNEYNN